MFLVFVKVSEMNTARNKHTQHAKLLMNVQNLSEAPVYRSSPVGFNPML